MSCPVRAGIHRALAVFATVVLSATVASPPKPATEAEADTQVRSHRTAFPIVLSVTPNSTAIE